MLHTLRGYRPRHPGALLTVAVLVLTAACQSERASDSTPTSSPSSSAVSTTDSNTSNTTDTVAGDAGDPVVVTATPTGESINVVAYADATGETVLTTSSGGTTFTIRIPSGALPNDITFSVTPATTSTGEPAMLVEPSGLALLRPARISVSGIADRLIAWGPTGVARLLPEKDETDASIPIVVLGGVARAHDDEQQRAASASGGSEIDRWAQSEEQDESDNPDGIYDADRKQQTAGAVGNGTACKPGDRQSANEALAAVRAGAALGLKPAPPPDCFDVSVKVTIGLSGDLTVEGSTIHLDEVMSGGGRLTPTDTGHAGDVSLAVQQSGLLRVGMCNPVRTTDEILGIAATWPGEGLAQIDITPKRVGTLDFTCSNGAKFDGVEMISGVTLHALAELTGGTMSVNAPVTEGSFYIFSLLQSTARVKEWRVAGREWQAAVSGANARFTFTVDVVYSTP